MTGGSIGKSGLKFSQSEDDELIFIKKDFKLELKAKIWKKINLTAKQGLIKSGMNILLQ